MMKTVIKTLPVAALLASSMMVSSSAQAGLLGNILSPVVSILDNTHPVLTFDFDGNFTFYAPDGTIFAPDGNLSPPITGQIKLDLLTFGGTAQMGGNFIGAPFTADGVLSAYVAPLAFLGIDGQCDGSFLCANANIDFTYFGFASPIVIPVEASFRLDPGNLLSPTTPVNLNNIKIGFRFNVESIDHDGDGILGTPIAPGSIFSGFTPSFTGVATLSKIALTKSIANPNISAVPEPTEWAMMLSGLALVSVAARRRMRKLEAE